VYKKVGFDFKVGWDRSPGQGEPHEIFIGSHNIEKKMV
jgi:hypothetical protein